MKLRLDVETIGLGVLQAQHAKGAELLRSTPIFAKEHSGPERCTVLMHSPQSSPAALYRTVGVTQEAHGSIAQSIQFIDSSRPNRSVYSPSILQVHSMYPNSSPCKPCNCPFLIVPCFNYIRVDRVELGALRPVGTDNTVSVSSSHVVLKLGDLILSIRKL